MKKRNTPPRRRNSGFTLIEMLIVVAIIAILIAVSIPMVNNALERARVATDAANERSAKAEATIMFLDGELDKMGTTTGKVYLAYDAVEGDLNINADKTAAEAAPSKGYGKCTTVAGGHQNNVIYVEIDKATGKVDVKWNAPGAAADKIEESFTTSSKAPHGTDLSS